MNSKEIREAGLGSLIERVVGLNNLIQAYYRLLPSKLVEELSRELMRESKTEYDLIILEVNERERRYSSGNWARFVTYLRGIRKS